MVEIKLEQDKKNEGLFMLYEDGNHMGQMVISISDNVLAAYHTEVTPEAKGKGFAKRLLDDMVAYVRQNELQVIPSCPYLYAQFKKNRELYNDVWK